jgi:predicted metal-dependent phosphoesterase TrpH
MYKCDFHIHTEELIKNKNKLKFTHKELAKEIIKHKYNAIAITDHNTTKHINTMKKYLKNKCNVINGIEMTINKNNHVIALNLNKECIKILNKNKLKIKNKEYYTWNTLKQIKKQNAFIIAVHPYYPKITNSLKENLEKNINLFDAIEFSHFYTKTINFNKKAIKIAKKYDLPLIGNTDMHRLNQLNKTYTLVNSKTNKTKDIINAIKNKKIKIKTKPLNIFNIIRNFLFPF